ncbi:MAG: hypothetical protein U0T83_00950 [Bacteriovoracaceae bacterium]
MSSKFQPWEFFEKISVDNLNNFSINKIKVLEITENITYELVKAHYFKNSNFFTKKSGKDITLSYVTDQFIAQDLFSNSAIKFIYEADEINKNIQEWLINNFSRWNNENIFFIFKKSNLLSLFLEKQTGIDFYKIESFKFWQNRECLKFLTNYFKLKMDETAFNLFLEQIPFDLNLYYNYVAELSVLKSDDQKVIASDLKLIYSEDLKDQFYFAKLINKRDLSNFFLTLSLHLKKENNFSEFRLLLNFIQSHFFKLLDPSYIEEKKKPSKYDLEIKESSKRWKKHEIIKFTQFLSEHMINCKKQDPLLFEKLYINFLRTI